MKKLLNTITQMYYRYIMVILHPLCIINFDYYFVNLYYIGIHLNGR